MIYFFFIKFSNQILEPKIPKSETIYIPLDEQEQRSRPQVSRQPPPIHISPEQIQHKPYTIPQNQPIQLPDYRSPYANKPYRERKYNNNPLPVIANNQSDRKSRPPLYEPRYRVEKYHTFTPIKPTSLVNIFFIFYFKIFAFFSFLGKISC